MGENLLPRVDMVMKTRESDDLGWIWWWRIGRVKAKEIMLFTCSEVVKFKLCFMSVNCVLWI